MNKKTKLVAIFSFIFFFTVAFVHSTQISADCGTKIPVNNSECDAFCYQYCKNQGKPDCTGAMDTWYDCCYSGMTTDYKAAPSQCQCDDVIDENLDNDPWIDAYVCYGTGQFIPPYLYCGDSFSNICCSNDKECQAIITPTPTKKPAAAPSAPTPTPTSGAFEPYSAPGNAFFDSLNPLQHGGGDTIFEDIASEQAGQLSTPGGIVSRLLVFAFPLAGLILFVMLVWGGFEILIQAPSKKAIDAGRQRVMAAIIGFILLFASYWIWQIIEVIFGVTIL